jgi:hypothetical protein
MMRHYQKSFFLSNILYIILLAYDTATFFINPNLSFIFFINPNLSFIFFINPNLSFIFFINPNLSFIFFMIIHEYDNYYFAYAKPSNLSFKVKKKNLIVL